MSNKTPQQPITGLHVLGEIHTKEMPYLKDILLVKEKISNLIDQVGFSRVGTAEYTFSEGGYTFVILLAESHVSIHTWPELNYVTLDVFACNVLRDNSSMARELFNSIAQLFSPTKISQREINR